MRYDFEWDQVKAKQNLSKHRISFQHAAMIFRVLYMVSIFDDEHSATEERWLTIGRNGNDRLLVVAHTFRQFSEAVWVIRMISAHKATTAEFHFPIYLGADITDFMSRLALQTERYLSELVNDWLRRDIELVQTVQ